MEEALARWRALNEEIDEALDTGDRRLAELQTRRDAAFADYLALAAREQGGAQ